MSLCFYSPFTLPSTNYEVAYLIFLQKYLVTHFSNCTGVLNLSNINWLVDEDWMTSHLRDYPHFPTSLVVFDLPSPVLSSFPQQWASDGNCTQKTLSKMITHLRFTHCNHEKNTRATAICLISSIPSRNALRSSCFCVGQQIPPFL